MNIPKYEETEPIIPKYEDTEPIEQKSVAGFGKNLWEDVKGTAVGVGGLAKGLMTQPVETVVNTAKALPSALVEEGKRIGIGELITGHPGKALGKFGEAMYEKPLTTTLDVLPAAGAAGKALGIGGKVARGTELAAEAGQAGKLARGAGLVDDVAQAGKVARGLDEISTPGSVYPQLSKMVKNIPEKHFGKFSDLNDTALFRAGQGTEGATVSLWEKRIKAGERPPVVVGSYELGTPRILDGHHRLQAYRNLGFTEIPTLFKSSFDEFSGAMKGAEGAAPTLEGIATRIGEKIPKAVKEPIKEVGEFLKSKYEKASGREGWGETFGEVLERQALKMRFKEMGAAPGQMRKLFEKIGDEKIKALGELAEEKGITDPIIGYKIGKNIENLENVSGKTIGDIRNVAKERGATHNPQELVSQIKSQLDQKYLKGGAASSEKGNYSKALQDIANTPPTPDALANTITKLNQYATKNQMVQKGGAFTDVANAASRINNKLIESIVKPEEFSAYKEALRDFSASQVYKRFYSFRYGREFAGRSGVGGLFRNIKQAAMDIGGNKFLEKVYSGLGKKIKKNPKIALNLQTLTEESLTEVLKAMDEVIDETIR